VIASGTTSSIMAAVDQAGVCRTGLMSSRWRGIAVSNLPNTTVAIAPTTSAPMIGGQRRLRLGSELRINQTTTIGPAMAMSLNSARTRSRPNRRKTPATMPITIGIGASCIARLTQPVAPSTSISALVA
jgi:hypothetical protein